MKTVTLEKDCTIKLSSNIVDYIYPDYVFIPMFEEFKLKVKNREEVKKEQTLLSAENKTIISPVSGVVVGVKNCAVASGETVKCLVIENDFKEKMHSRTTIRKKLKQLSKNEFFQSLEKKQIFDYDFLKTKKFNKIIINGIEDEPYMATKLFTMSKYSSEILEILSLLAALFDVSENIIVLKNNDRDNIELFSNVLGTYPEINLNVVPDIYPIGKEIVLKNYINFSKEETLILSPLDLVKIYSILKKNKVITEKLITISGNAIINPFIVNAKIGSSVKKIIDEHVEYINNDDLVYVINGLMCGVETSIEDLVVTEDLEGIIINKKEMFVEQECINCGKCFDVCPVAIDPHLIFNKKKNVDLANKCINCGLCTYICPVYINFKRKIEDMIHEE